MTSSRTISSPLVSVVVTTKNEEKNIERCLRSVKSQTWSNIEIIVVDNNSSDKTKELARQFTTLVFDKGPERSAQRNYGMIQVAKGELVMFVDADMILTPSLVTTCVSRMAVEDCVALHIPEIILGRTFWCRVRRFERGFYNGTVIDGARLFRQDIFRAVGGFNETISAAEDWDTDKRIKRLGSIALLPEKSQQSSDSKVEWDLSDFVRVNGVNPNMYDAVIYHNEIDFNLKGYLNKKIYYSSDFGPYISLWGKDDPDVRHQFGFFYRYCLVFVENGKWKKLLSSPVLAMGMFFLRFLVGLVFLRWSLTASKIEK